MSWKSSKQETVADSTTEAESIVASEAAKEGVWIRKFLTELGVFLNVSSPLDLSVTTMGLLRRQGSLGIIKRTNMYCGNFF